MNIPVKKKFTTPEPCGSMGDSITVEELAARQGGTGFYPGAAGLAAQAWGPPIIPRPRLLKFSLNGEELLIETNSIDAILRTERGSNAGAGICVRGKVFYVDEEYDEVKKMIYG